MTETMTRQAAEQSLLDYLTRAALDQQIIEQPEPAAI